MRYLYQFIYTGYHYGAYPSAKRGIVISNAIGIIIFSISLVLGILYYFWFKINLVTVSIPIIGLLCLSTTLINHFGYTKISRLWISLLIPVIVTILSVSSKIKYPATQQELDFFTYRFIILATCTFPWILFSFKERNFLVLTSILGFTIIMMYDPIHAYFDVPYSFDSSKNKVYQFTNIVVLFSYCILTSAVAFLKWVSERSESKNLVLIKELNNANNTLVAKNQEINKHTQDLEVQSIILQKNQEQLQDAYNTIHAQKLKLQTKNDSLEQELIEKNQDLSDTNAELIKHNNELRQFSYTISHNLRGPIASLLGLINLLRPQALSDDSLEIIDHIKMSSLRLDAIIKDLNKIIDIRHDIFHIRQKVNLNTEINEVVAILKREIDQYQVSIIRNLSNCPALYSVKPMVHSILYNLISNAIKYKSTERSPVIEINVSEDSTYYKIEIRDNGLGIDIERNHENLFKLYKRFHTHTEGKGLGLYLVKLQAESLGGLVTVKSELNKYTQFTVLLKKPENVQRQVLMKEHYAEIFFDASLNTTGVVWHGPVTTIQYKNTFRKCLEFVKAYNTPNYLADVSSQGPIEKADQLWMITEILPEASRNGLRCIALVRPDANNELVREYLDSINEELQRLAITQKYFQTQEEAEQWIESENIKQHKKDHHGIPARTG